MIDSKTALALLGVTLAAAGSLTQCSRDVGRQLARETGYEARLKEGFGPISSELLGETDDGGQILEQRVTSTKGKSWMDADLLFLSIQACGEGRHFSYEHVAPAIDYSGTSAAQPERKRPKGTTFIRRLTCEGHLPNEFDLEPGLSDAEAVTAVLERMQANNLNDPDGVNDWAAIQHVNSHRPKYTAFSHMLGISAKNAFRRCNGPATLENVMVGNLPTDPSNTMEGSGRFVFGVDFACAKADAVASSPPSS